jgi:hypothetical protein
MHSVHPFAAIAAARAGRLCLAAAALFFVATPPAAAQTGTFPPGLYLEAEGQIVFGESRFEAGIVPDDIFGFTGPKAELDEGNGPGGALAIGYTWGTGWSAAVRYRLLKGDDKAGRFDPGILTFGAGMDLVPGGFMVGVLDARTEVESKTSIVDLEVGKEIAVGGGHLQVFGGLTYASIERDVAIIDDCGCIPFSMLFSNDFHGVGPKIGFRGGVPLNTTISLVGSASAAALFGTSKFATRLDDPLSPPFPYKDEDDRTVAALDAQAGVAVAVGPGSLTFGYRIDALVGALDTDQRVSPLFQSAGLAPIGDKHTDFVAHGPFARFTLPLAAVGN